LAVLGNPGGHVPCSPWCPVFGMLMAGERLGVSPRPGGLAPVRSVTRGDLEVTDGARAEAMMSLCMADGSEVRRLAGNRRGRHVQPDASGQHDDDQV
jgi:hypothetical protein